MRLAGGSVCVAARERPRVLAPVARDLTALRTYTVPDGEAASLRAHAAPDGEAAIVWVAELRGARRLVTRSPRLAATQRPAPA